MLVPSAAARASGRTGSRPEASIRLLPQGRAGAGEILHLALAAILAAGAMPNPVARTTRIVRFRVVGIERAGRVGGERVRSGRLGGVHRVGQGLWHLIGSGPFRATPILGALIALQHGVAFQLLLDEGRHFHVGKLQQLDGLPQLRGHHQRLRLAQVETGADRHGQTSCQCA